MEILFGKSYQKLLDFLPEIKRTLEEWLLVDIKLIGSIDNGFDAHQVAAKISNHFDQKEGKIYVCKEHELIMLIRSGKNPNMAALTVNIESTLPPGKCEIRVDHPTPESLSKLVISVKDQTPSPLEDYSVLRRSRSENVILIADDDMYMRTLLRKGLPPHYKVHEIVNGSEILSAYQTLKPDILFLDIHMPGKDGFQNLKAVLESDPHAFVIMLSSDSSAANVVETTKKGAKGFLAKPISKEKLLAYVQACPTIS